MVSPGCNTAAIRFHVGLRSGVGLYVGVLGAKEFLGALSRQLFHHVGKLAAAVVALAGIALGILVGEDRTHGFEHGFADKIFRGDQFQAFVLAANFVIDGGGYLRIYFVERAGHGIIFHDVFGLLASSFWLPASSVFGYGLRLIAYCFWLLGFRPLASVFLGGAGLQPCINTPE